MFCTRCGLKLRETDNFCSGCGTATANPAPPAGDPVRLSRSLHDRKIAGVCAGVARYLQVDPTLIRVIAVVALFWPVPSAAALAYIILWAVMPQDPRAITAPFAAPHFSTPR
jgi:phage shock protein C